MYTVYCLEFPDGRKYIGTTSLPLAVRFNHGNGYRFSPKLWEVIQAIGWENVIKYPLAVNVSLDQANALEKHYISFYRTCEANFGFNIELGGRYKCKEVADSSREKMSVAKRGELNPNYGKVFSGERCRKISEGNKGKKRTAETCRNIGLSKEKAVIQFSEDGELLAIWESARKAAFATGTQVSHISKVCHHQRATAGGYVWRFLTK